MMNRPENVFYNFDQSAATATNENAEGDFVGTAEKLAMPMTNPMNIPSNNSPAVRTHASMMDDTAIRHSPGKATSHAALIDDAATRPATGKSTSQAATNTTTNLHDLPMPKRNLSAYNLFFQVERENIIKGEEGMNYTHENIARVALRHYQQGKMELPRRKHRKTHGKISFAELARSVANRWKQLDPSIKEMFIQRTNIEKARYQAEIADWADRKLRSKPPSPKREPQTESFTLIDIFKPNVKAAANNGVDGTNISPVHSDAINQAEYIMPHRVFPPSTTSQVVRSQPTTHVNVENFASEFNNTRYADMYSQYSPGLGLVDPNNFYDFTQRYRSTTTNEYGSQMQQYPQLNLQPVPTTFAMTLQQQFDMMNERHGLGDTQSQTSVQGYPTSFSMRSPSTIQEQMSSQWGEGFVSMPNDYTTNEAFQRSIQHQAAFGTLSNQSEGGMQLTGPGQMRNETKADDNETIDLQSLFNRFDSN